MRLQAILCICAVLAFASYAHAFSLVLGTVPAQLYSTAKQPLAINFLLEFSGVSCPAEFEEQLRFTIPKWYVAPKQSDINAFVRADENTLRYVSCIPKQDAQRDIECLAFSDGNALSGFTSLSVKIPLVTNTSEGNPIRTEQWNSSITCNPGAAQTLETFVGSIEVYAPVIEITSPQSGIISGTVIFTVAEVKGIPYYVRFKLEHPAAIIPEMSDSARPDGWSVSFDSTTVGNATVVLKAYACDHTLRCAEAVEKVFAIQNAESGQPPLPPQPQEQDTVAPLITAESPKGQILNQRPLISAAVEDSNLSVGSISLTLDGTEVQHSYDPATKAVSYKPAENIALGTHEVRLSVSDIAGNESSSTWLFEIVEQPAPQQPQENAPPRIARLVVSNQAPKQGEQIALSAEVNDPDSAALSYLWEFGDGASSTEPSVSHSYSLPADENTHVYTITLTVSDGASTASASYAITVERPVVQPQPAQQPQPEEEPVQPAFPAEAALAALAAAIVICLAIFLFLKMKKTAASPREIKLPAAPKEAAQPKKAEIAEPARQKATGAEKKPLADAMRETLISFQSQFRSAHGKGEGLDTRLKGLSESEREEARRLVFLLEREKGRYSRAEMLRTILGEGYSTQVAEKVVELLYSGKGRLS